MYTATDYHSTNCGTKWDWWNIVTEVCITDYTLQKFSTYGNYNNRDKYNVWNSMKMPLTAEYPVTSIADISECLHLTRLFYSTFKTLCILMPSTDNALLLNSLQPIRVCYQRHTTIYILPTTLSRCTPICINSIDLIHTLILFMHTYWILLLV